VCMPLEIRQIGFLQPPSETKVLRVIQENETTIMYADTSEGRMGLFFPLDDAVPFDVGAITGHPERIHIWSDGHTWFIRRGSGDYIRIIKKGGDLFEPGYEPQCNGNWVTVETEFHFIGKTPNVVQLRRLPTEREIERDAIDESDYI
jgi:hypothetical protein